MKKGNTVRVLVQPVVEPVAPTGLAVICDLAEILSGAGVCAMIPRKTRLLSSLQASGARSLIT